MNRGFHAFFRQYYNLRDMLRRIDSDLGMLTPVEDYPLVDGQGRRDTFRGLPQTPPLNALAFALRSPTFRLRDLVRLNARAAAPLAAVSVPDIYERLDHLDADSFLRDINFPVGRTASGVRGVLPQLLRRARRAVGGRAGHHVPHLFPRLERGPDLRRGQRQLRCRTVEPVAPVSGVARRELPHRRIRHRGGHRTATSRVRTDSGADFDCDGVVLATDVAGLQHIVDGSPGLGDDGWRARVATMGTAPPFVVQRLWLDQPVLADRAPFLGTGGRPPLDNVSVLERYEREAKAWCDRTGGSVVELHSYSVTGPTDDLRDRMLARLYELYPESAGRQDRPRTRAVPRRLPPLRARRPCRKADGRHPASRGRCWRATVSASTCPSR